MKRDERQFYERELFRAASAFEDRLEREKFLSEECRGQPGLKERMERLLAARSENRISPLNRAVQNAADAEAPYSMSDLNAASANDAVQHIDIDQKPVIDRYQLMEEIGRGGMGTVYMALQKEPVRRRVALKVINAGMNSRNVLARFEAERQTLAMMNHPNIARVLDGGKTETGLPYFVMELVRGHSVLKFFHQDEIPLRQRLQLFVEICGAVYHAHQKGVIHRDLKPSNILIEKHDATVVPRIIDFGIAKAIGGDHENPHVTGFREVLGTPMYMSPEQAEFNALDVDTRSDIYSLGVLLYELVANQPPFDPERIRTAGFSELFQIIRDETPPRRSTAVTVKQSHLDTAGGRGSFAGTMVSSRRIRGELDWIVMKALEKDRLRRYQSARELADDVRRFLNHEPVAARPASVVYRAQKTIRQHRAIFFGSLATMAALLLGTGAALWQAWEADNARTLAESRTQLVAETNRQLVEQVEISEHERTKTNELLYATELHLASTAWLSGDVSRARLLLDRQTAPSRIHLTDSFEWKFLHHCVEKRPQWTANTLGQVRCARISPDSRWVAVAGDDAVLRVFAAHSGRTICEHPVWTMLNSVAWTPDGRQIACACADGTVRLFSFGSAEPDQQNTYVLQPLHSLEAQTDPATEQFVDDEGAANDALFTPDGNLLLTTGDDTRIRIWDRHKETLTGLLTGHQRAVERLAISPDGDVLASAGSDETLRLWDLQECRQLSSLTFSGRVVSVAYAQDGSLVAAGCITGDILIFDMETEEVSRCSVLDGVESLAFLSSPLRLVAGDRAGTIHLWKLTDHSGHRFSEKPHRTWSAGDSRIQSLAAIGRNGQIITGSQNGRVCSWSVAEAASRAEIRHVRATGFDHSGQLLLASHQLLRLNTEEGYVSPSEPFSAIGWNRIAVSRNSDRAILISDEKIMVRALAEDISLAEWDCDKSVSHVSISADGRRVALVDNDSGFVEVRYVNGGMAVHRMPVISCNCVEFSPNGKAVAVGCLNDMLLYSLDSEDPPVIFSGHSSTLSCLSFSPDGRHIVTGSHDRHIRVWDAATGEMLLNVAAHPERVTTVRYCADGSRIVSADASGRVCVWHADSLQPLLEIVLPNRPPTTFAALSPDGRRLAALDDRQILSVFETESSTDAADTDVGSDASRSTGTAIDFRALGDLPGGNLLSQASGISADGALVVGLSYRAGGFSPFVWSEQDGMTLLGPMPPEGGNGQCNFVSLDNSVFGGAGGTKSERGYSPRLWYTDGSTMRLHAGRGSVTNMSADAKTIVGYTDDSGRRTPFVYRNTVLNQLQLPQQTNHGQASAVTPDGRTILGTAYNTVSLGNENAADANNDWRDASPVLWKHAKLHELSGFDPKWNCRAVDISDDGSIIIGNCWSPGARIHAPGARMFIWQNGEVEVVEPPRGFLELRPQAISGDGTTIVGLIGQGLDGGPSHAFCWTRAHGFLDLNALRTSQRDLSGWTLVDALAVTPDGRTIVGYGVNPDGNREAWRLRLSRSSKSSG